MKNSVVKAVDIPLDARIRTSLKTIDYADAYSVDIDSSAGRIDELFRTMLRETPDWVESLMRLRDRIVSLARLKASIRKTNNAPTGILSVGDRFGIFRITELYSDEVLFGEDDRHLDFRVSLSQSANGQQKTITIATVVQFNNALGRTYFFVVEPFHKQVVKSMMLNLIRKLSVEQG